MPESAAHFSTSVTNEINLWRSLTFCDLATILRRLRALEYEPMLRTQHLIRLVSLSLLLAHAVSAQQDRSRSNSTASDTMRSGGDAWLLLPFLGAFVSALAAAPPAILLLRSHLTPPDSLGGLRVRMLTVFVSAGGTGEVPHTAAYSGGIQLLDGHLFAAARGEDIRPSTQSRFFSVSAGYLTRPLSPFAGGITIGYRRSYAPSRREAPEVSLPLLWGNKRSTALFAPTYVISRSGVKWTYRWQVDFYGLPEPLFAGFLFEAQPLRDGVSGILALHLGARF